MVASGQLKPTDMVWHDGMTSWTSVAQVADLRGQGLTPKQRQVPPIPGSAVFLPPPMQQSDRDGQRLLENKHINPLVALAASFFCLPLGPVILGQTKKAVMVTLLTVIGFCLCLVPGILVSWMAVFESYLVAQAISEGKSVRENEYRIELLYKIVKVLDKTAFFPG
jgi:hypothetical protein